MKIKYIVALMTVIATAGGCTQDTGEQPEEAVPIRFAATIAPTDNGKTRAAGDWGERTTTLTQGTEFLNGEHVFVYIKENDGAHQSNIKWPIEYQVANDGDGDADDGDLNPVSDTTPFFFPVGVNTINIHAIHPSYTSGAGFTVQTDQTTEANYVASDLCYSKPTDYTRTGSGTDIDTNGRRILWFKHLLSKIVVNLTVDAGSATGVPSYISLHAKTSTAMSFPADNANGYTGCTPSDATTPGVIKIRQEAIIPPQTIAAGASFLSMTVPGIGPMIYPMPAATSFQSGMCYTYNIQVTDTEIIADTDISNWGGGEYTTNVLGKKMYTIVRNQTNNPLYYVLDKDWNSSATALITTTSCGDNVYFDSWTNAMNTFVGSSTSRSGYNSTSTKTIDGIKLVFPTTQMWLSIVPCCWGVSGSNYSLLAEGTTTSGGSPCNGSTYGVWTEYASCFKQAQEATAYKSYWGRKIDGVDSYHPTRYAIRYIGTNYCSIWKYTYEGTYGEDASSDYRTVIRSQLISSPLFPTLTTNTSFGSTADEKALLQLIIDRLESGDHDWEDSNAYEERVFYALGCGVSGGSSTMQYKGQYVVYFAASNNDDPRSNYNGYTSLTLGAGSTSLDSGWDRTRCRAVRMFRDN